MTDSLEKASILGFIAAILLFSSLLYLVLSMEFPLFSTARNAFIPIELADSGGVGISGFLWNKRGFDMLMLSLVLFAVSVCCLAMLKEEG